MALTGCSLFETSVSSPDEWETLEDMRVALDAATDDCPESTEGGSGFATCDNSQGYYLFALDTPDHPNAASRFKIALASRERDAPEYVVWGDGWAVNCWGPSGDDNCGKIETAIPGGTKVSLDPGDGFTIGESAEDAAAQGGPVTSFMAGTFAVGTDIEPGTYRTDGGQGCYWQRLSGFGGTSNDRIANDFSREKKQTYVTIMESDAAFETRNCGTWELVE